MTKFVPVPPDDGGKRRALAVLRRLAALGPLTLCAFDEGSADPGPLRELGVEVRSVPWDPSPARVARGLARTGSISAARFWDARLATLVRDACATPPDLLQVEYAQLAPYAHGLSAGLRVLDLHNIESSLTASYAGVRGPLMGTLLRGEAAAVRRIERRALASFDVVVVVSERDRQRLPAAAREVLVCPNGCEPADMLPPAAEPVAAFVALLGWAPNVDAAVWLAEEVWPLVRAKVDSARLKLVGRDPAPSVRALSAADVEVTGTVRDVAPHLAATRVALAPLRAGGGSRLKVLEALDAGRPVVATTVGVEGLEDLVGRGVVVADDPAQMAATLAELLVDAERATTLGRTGHDAVARDYGWDSTLAPLLGRVTRA